MNYKVLGWIIIIANALYIVSACHYYYLYNYTSQLFIYMFPQPLLLMWFIMGTLGVWQGWRTIKKSNSKPKINVIAGILIFFVSFVIAIIYP